MFIGDECYEGTALHNYRGRKCSESHMFNKTSLYLHFCANICTMLEKVSNISTQLYKIIESFQTRIEKNFYASRLNITKKRADKTVYQR